MTHLRGLSIALRTLRALAAASLVLAGLALQAASQEGSAAPSEGPAEARGAGEVAAVEFRGETLFSVRAPIDELGVASRAERIEQRLLAIAAGPTDVLSEIRVEPQVASHDVRVGETLVTSVLDADAQPTGRTRAQLAADYTLALTRALDREFRSRSVQGLALGLGMALAATLALGLGVWAVRWATRRSTAAILARAGSEVRELRIRGFTFLTAERVTRLTQGLVRVAGGLVIAVMLYVYVQEVLGFFPWTRGLADKLLEFGRGVLAWLGGGVWEYLPNLFYIAVIIVAARTVLRALRFLFREIDRGAISIPGFYPEWADPTYKIVRGIAIAFTLVVVFPYLPGAGSPAFQGVSVFFGVLFSLGSASAVGNAVAGVVLTYMRPFRDGDRVRIADTIGDVVEKTLLVVRIRTIKNVEITIPNASVLANHIVNYSAAGAKGGLILHTEVTIGYDVPWRTVHALLILAAAEVEGLLADPPPFVLQTKLNDFYVHYELNVRTDRPNEMAVLYARLHERVQDEFARAGVEIMSPHYAAARDGNTVALPPESLPPGYEAPAFRVTTISSERKA